MGMRNELRSRWQEADGSVGYAFAEQSRDRIAGFSSAIKSIRFFAQSIVLGVGALLAINGQVSPGTMIAASILAGRAMAPIDLIVAHWRETLSTSAAFSRLSDALGEVKTEPRKLVLPPPKGALDVEHVVAQLPGQDQPFIRGVNFRLSSGEVLGVVGPSAAGKSTLAKIITGLLPVSSGSVRLDGADIGPWLKGDLGRHLGYLPQDLQLFAGSVHENICRFRQDVDPEDVFKAAELVGIDDMVRRLPDGYDTQIGPDGVFLSAGQRQRLGLARAVFGNPALVVLDEPNSNLDAEGDAAFSAAIQSLKARGTTVVIVAHRPSALAHADKVIAMHEGRMVAFGPKADVLAQLANGAPGPNVSRMRRST